METKSKLKQERNNEVKTTNDDYSNQINNHQQISMGTDWTIDALRAGQGCNTCLLRLQQTIIFIIK